MHINARTNVVSERRVGPQAAQEPVYSQPYYPCLTLTDVPKLMPAAHSHSSPAVCAESSLYPGFTSFPLYLLHQQPPLSLQSILVQIGRLNY